MKTAKRLGLTCGIATVVTTLVGTLMFNGPAECGSSHPDCWQGTWAGLIAGPFVGTASYIGWAVIRVVYKAFSRLEKSLDDKDST
jgi:hypothetical protein